MSTRIIRDMSAAELLEHLIDLQNDGAGLEYVRVYVRNPAGDREPLEAVAVIGNEMFFETHQDYVPGALKRRPKVELD